MQISEASEEYLLLNSQDFYGVCSENAIPMI